MSNEYNESNTVHSGADVQDSVPLTLEQVRDALRNDGELSLSCAKANRLSDAIDAHLAKAGEPKISAGVPYVLVEDMDEGYHPEYGQGLFATHDCVRVDPPSAEPAQPVEAVDVPTALRFAADVIELYDDATTCDDYMISATDAADIVRALAERAALDEYATPYAQGAWLGWQAALSAQAPSVAVGELENLFTHIEWPPQETQWVILREDFDNLISKAGRDE